MDGRKPYRDLYEDAKHHKNPGEIRNSDSFFTKGGKAIRDTAGAAVSLLDPGVQLASELGTAAGAGDYKRAAFVAPFLALNALGLKGLSKAKSAFAKPHGLPETIKLPGDEEITAAPLRSILEARRDYMRQTGNRRVPVGLDKHDAELGTRVAGAYETMADDLSAPGVTEAYEALAKETRDQYRALTNRGIKFRFMGKDDAGNFVDPYAASPALGYKDLRDKGELQVFPTEGGFGSLETANTAHPLLRDSGEVFADGQPALNNDLFRAVHDAFGHNAYGNAFFRAPGEDRAFQLHATMYSPKATSAAASELRGQNSWLNYGPYGEQNRLASGADTVFADQKTGLMPAWTRTEGMAQTAPSDLPYAFVPSRALEDDDR